MQVKRKKFIAMLCAAAVMTTSAGGLPLDNGGLFDTAVKASAEAAQYKLSVRFTPSGDANNWEKAYCHYWEDNEDGSFINGHTTAWPGIEMSKDGSDWVLETTSEWNPTGIIFDNGASWNDGGMQTIDLPFYYINGDAIYFNELTYNDGSFGEYTATSTPFIAVSDISLSPNEKTLTVGESFALTATISPNDATDKTIKWTSNNDSVKLYSNEDCTDEVGTDATSTFTVYAKCISAGNATVTATSNVDSIKSASCDVTVNEAPKAPDITVSPNSNIVYDGEKLDISDFTFDGEDASLINSSNTTITIEGDYILVTGGTLVAGNYFRGPGTYTRISGTKGFASNSTTYYTGSKINVDASGTVKLGSRNLGSITSSQAWRVSNVGWSGGARVTRLTKVNLSTVPKYDLISAGRHVAIITIYVEKIITSH